MKLIYPVFLSSNIVADNIMQTHQWQVLAENQKVRSNCLSKDRFTPRDVQPDKLKR